MDVKKLQPLSGYVVSTPRPPAKEEPRRLRRVQFCLRLSERRLLLAAGDLLALNLALAVVLALRPTYAARVVQAPLFTLFWERLPWFLLLSVLWLVAGLLFNVYDLARAASALHSVWATGGAALLSSVLYTLVPYVTPALPGRRSGMLLFPFLAVAGAAAWRIAYAKVLVQPGFHQTALVVGAGWAGQVLARAIAESSGAPGNPYRGTGYQVLGFIDDNLMLQGRLIEGIRVVGTRYDLVLLARLLRPDELIVAITDMHQVHPDLFQAILECSQMGIHVTTMTELYERLTGRVPVEHAGRNLHVILPTDQPAAHRVYMALWRLAEIAAGVLGCAFTGLAIPLVWLADRIASPGDLFYHQERVGKGGKTFYITKFRSMVMDAEKGSGAVWARQEDSRVTPVGRFLRKTRLDEVPQFWNVLKGEMGLIGPRPERPEFVRQLVAQIPFYGVRHAVKPGITGWAQVMYRYGSSVEDALVKLQHDLYYIKHQGPYLDFAILIRTVRSVLRMEGR
jgi:exopolysaccharide biosynthesis polyprenyl glycosylphosphotransferase